MRWPNRAILIRKTCRCCSWAQSIFKRNVRSRTAARETQAGRLSLAVDMIRQKNLGR